MNQEERIALRKRLETGLYESCGRWEKGFWIGFITALSDYHLITPDDFRYLLDTIDLWRKGDMHSRMVTPDNFRLH